MYFVVDDFIENQRKNPKKKKGKLTWKELKGWKKELISDDEAWEMRKRDARRDRIYLWQDRVVPYEIDQELGNVVNVVDDTC